MNNLQPPNIKNPMFGIYTGKGGTFSNGNGIGNRWITIYFFRKHFNFTLWTWKEGNGDSGGRCQ